MTDSTTALQDISDHVNELESVLESLNKTCPSPIRIRSNVPPQRLLLESPSTRSLLESLKQQQQIIEGFKAPLPIRDSSSFSRITPSRPIQTPLAKRSINAVKSSPNVTITAESQLNLKHTEAKSKSESPPAPQPIRATLKSPEQTKSPQQNTPPLSPPQDPDAPIDVVTMDVDNSNDSPSPKPSLKRKADCMDSEPAKKGDDDKEPQSEEKVDDNSEDDQSDAQPSVKSEKENGIDAKSTRNSSVEFSHLPTDTELTKQLMSVIQNTLTQHSILSGSTPPTSTPQPPQNTSSSSTPNITCPECGIVFVNELNLHRHMLVHLQADKTEPEQYFCPSCAFKTPRKQTLNKHINTVHSRDKSSGILYCDQCEYKTPTKSHLRNHMLAHTGNRQYQCPHCTYNSNFSNALTRHMTMHSREIFDKVSSFKH